MGAFSNYLEFALLAHTLAGVPFPPPESHFLALCTGNPGEALAVGAGLANEVPPTGALQQVYARQPVVFSIGTNIDNAVVQNLNNVTFLQMPACTVTYLAITDSPAGPANLLYYTAISPVSVPGGGTLSVPAGALSITLD